jgi:hypothetical protein
MNRVEHLQAQIRDAKDERKTKQIYAPRLIRMVA